MRRSGCGRFVGVVVLVASGMAALPSGPTRAQTPAPADNEAVLWDAPSYGGASVTYPFATSVADLATSGWNDRIRSVAVGRYTRVLAFENAGFGGRCITFSGTSVGGATGRYADLAAQNASLSGSESWAGRVSSVRVVDGRTGANCANPGGTATSTTATSTTATPSTAAGGAVAADQVQVFDMAGYCGAVQAWTGATAVANLGSVRMTPSGTWSRRTSAVRVGASMRVLAFDATNFKGKCLTLAGSAAGGATGGDYPDLAAQNAGLTGRSTWNNRIASLRIVTAASGVSCADLTGIQPANGEAVVFDLANFGEPVQRWTVPTDVPNLSTVVRPPRSRWDNVVSAVKVGANVRVLAYENRNYLGKCITFAGSAVGGATQGAYPDLRAQNAGLTGSAHWDNRISSLKVVDGRTGASCTSAGGAATSTTPATSTTRPPGGVTTTTVGATSTTGGPGGSGSGGKQTAAVSMGDSFISGEAGRWQGNADPAGATDRGTNRYEPARTTTAATSSGTTTINTAAGCHRSDVAEIHTAALPVDVRVNLACSGATTADFANEQSKPAEAQVGSRFVTPQLTQLDKAAKDYDVKLIVVSIGGNDLGFADVIAACGKIYVLRTREMAEHFGSTCNAEQRAAVESKLGLAMTRVGAVISDIRAIMQRNGYAPSSYRIILQSYPSPIPRARDFGVPEAVPQIDRVAGFFTGAVAGTAAFPWAGPWAALAGGAVGQAAASVPPRLTVGRCPFWDVDATWARDSLVPLIADNLRLVAVRAGVDFLDLRDLFEGHEVCSETATRPGTAATGEWARFVSVYDAPVDQLADPQGDQQESMHPNAWGQQAIGRCLTLAYASPAGTVSSCFNRPGQPPSAAYTVAQACQSPATGQVCVFDAVGAGGDPLSWYIPAELPDLSRWGRLEGGNWNDRISSAVLGAGSRVIAFENTNYQGACITFDASGSAGGRYPDLAAENAGLAGTASWNDRISSLLVVRTDSGRSCADVTGLTPVADQALLFESADYNGAWLSLFHHTELRDLAKWSVKPGTTWNDRISSVKLGANVRVLGFEEVNFGGKCLTLAGVGAGGGSGRYPALSAQNDQLSTGTWDNRISSLKVVDGRTGVSCANQAVESPAANQVFLYENVGYGGESLGFTLGANIANLTTWFRQAGGNWNDRISSMKVGEGVRLLVFEHTNYGGRCFVAGGRLDSSANQGNWDTLVGVDYNLASGDWNDRISSIQVVDRATICPGA